MKIKLLKDIPGYKAGDVIDTEVGSGNSDCHSYFYKNLLRDGWAEEVKDEIDIEEVRLRYSDPVLRGYTIQEADFFNAYRIVKHVIDTLNGDWRPDWNNDRKFWNIRFNYDLQQFQSTYSFSSKYSLLNECKDEETAEKVISLCEPELKVLFGV